MKNIFEVLLQKEAECTALQKQVQALRMVIPLLAEDGDRPRTAAPTEEQAGMRQWP